MTGDHMTEMSGEDRPLPAERAFVVQLHVEANVARGRVAGRVVHVVSGQTTHFDTLDDLLTFIDRVLTSLHGKPSDKPLEEP
jgi:hypothetical protein